MSETDEMPCGYELLDQWENTYGRYEGDSGVRNLEQLCTALDPDHYKDLEDFLADNPGACDAMVDWIINELDTTKHWKENLIETFELKKEEEADEIQS